MQGLKIMHYIIHPILCEFRDPAFEQQGACFFNSTSDDDRRQGSNIMLQKHLANK